MAARDTPLTNLRPNCAGSSEQWQEQDPTLIHWTTLAVSVSKWSLSMVPVISLLSSAKAALSASRVVFSFTSRHTHLGCYDTHRVDVWGCKCEMILVSTAPDSLTAMYTAPSTLGQLQELAVGERHTAVRVDLCHE